MFSSKSRARSAAVGFVVFFLSGFMVSALAGCAVNEGDIEFWKRSVKGPKKLVAVTLADKYPVALRSKAALALVQMQRQDVDGVAELKSTVERLQREERQTIIDGMRDPLIEILQGRDDRSIAANESSESTDGPRLLEVRAKDAAYILIPYAAPAAQKPLQEAVVRWYAVDFNGRSLAGNYSAEQVIRSFGAAAAPLLVEALDAKMPSPALIKLTQLIGQMGDANAKKQASLRLVAIEKEIEGPAFAQWLGSEIKAQLQQRSASAGQSAGQSAPPAISDAKLAEAVAINRENFLLEGVIPAMKYLAGQPAVSERLLAMATKKSNDPRVSERRTRALQALEGKVGPEHLNVLLDLALDASNPDAVRDYAFDRVGDIGSRAALPRLWPLVASAKDARLRWRAGELVLAIGGGGIIDEFFSRLPSSKDVEYPPEELEGYATRISQISPLPMEAMQRALSSARWWERVVALRFFERKGALTDVASVQKLTGDSTTPKGKGWEKTMTVGKVAELVINSIKQRAQ
jgi:hypothetical protein